MSSYRLMFPGVRCSMFSGFGLNPPVSGFQSYFYSSLKTSPSPFKDNGCFSGCLMSSVGIQKLFCGIYSVFKCSFDEFVGGESGVPVLFLHHLRTALKWF